MLPWKPFKSIHILFEEQVKQCPNNIAIYLEQGSISYDSFNKKANQYARYLQSKGFQRNGLVGIQLMRSAEMLIAIFAVFKAGGAYLPLDPKAPKARNQLIIDEAKIQFLITDDTFLANCMADFNDRNINFLSINEDLMEQNSDNLNLKQAPQDLAYVMYTSGTTGKPKGVMISHDALVNRILWMQKVFPLQSQDTVFHKTYTCFDISVWEICWWAVTGAGVVLLPPQQEHNIKLFVQMIERYQISVMQLVPSVLRIFLNYIKTDFSIERLSSLKYVFCGGEALDAHSVNLFNTLFQDQKTLLANVYGPTEATIDVSYFICDKQKQHRIIPIGKPIDNIQFFVLDEHLNLTGSEPGELYISGIGLAKGYLNNPILTKSSFIDNPYLPGKKMYKTGDLVYWNEQNELVFIGRKDDQIKLRGLRIELSEIQYHLLEHPAIQDAVVICEKIDDLHSKLIAFLISKQKPSLNKEELKSYLETKIPIYMVPEQYVWVSALPVKENGKIDKEKLLCLA